MVHPWTLLMWIHWGDREIYSSRTYTTQSNNVKLPNQTLTLKKINWILKKILSGGFYNNLSQLPQKLQQQSKPTQNKTRKYTHPPHTPSPKQRKHSCVCLQSNVNFSAFILCPLWKRKMFSLTFQKSIFLKEEVLKCFFTHTKCN